MNSTQSKFRQQPAWGNTNVINSIQQHYIVYSYTLHKKNLDLIKVDPTKKMVDNEEPQSYKTMQEKMNHSKSRIKLQPLSVVGGRNKPEREKHLEQDIENGSLINRMLQITEKGSIYNKDLMEKQIFRPDKNNVSVHRKKEAYRVNSENLLIHNRLEKVQSTISFNTYQKQYDKYKKYKDNITRSSRRIFNCFIKTPNNHDLMATSSTAYGKFQHSKVLSQGSPNENKDTVITNKGKSKQSKSKSRNNHSDADVQFHQFPEDSKEGEFLNSVGGSHAASQQEKDILPQHSNKTSNSGVTSKRNSQLTNKSEKNLKPNPIHSKKGSISQKSNHDRKSSEQIDHIKISEEQQQQQKPQQPIEEDQKVQEPELNQPIIKNDAEQNNAQNEKNENHQEKQQQSQEEKTHDKPENEKGIEQQKQ